MYTGISYSTPLTVISAVGHHRFGRTAASGSSDGSARVAVNTYALPPTRLYFAAARTKIRVSLSLFGPCYHQCTWFSVPRPFRSTPVRTIRFCPPFFSQSVPTFQRRALKNPGKYYVCLLVADPAACNTDQTRIVVSIRLRVLDGAAERNTFCFGRDERFSPVFR